MLLHMAKQNFQCWCLACIQVGGVILVAQVQKRWSVTRQRVNNQISDIKSRPYVRPIALKTYFNLVIIRLSFETLEWAPKIIIFRMIFDAYGIKQQLYRVAERHLDIKETPRTQADAWIAIEAEVPQTNLDLLAIHTYLSSIVGSFYRHFRTFLGVKAPKPVLTSLCRSLLLTIVGDDLRLNRNEIKRLRSAGLLCPYLWYVNLCHLYPTTRIDAFLIVD